MSYVKWIAIVLFWGFIALFLLYTLPQNDIARVTDTYEKRMDLGNNSMFWARPEAGSSSSTSRDVFFIQTRLANGDVMVYRNEDTGWGWPPYFKFDSSNLQAEAVDFKSTAAAPQWVAITHYGARFEFLTIFPNALSIRPVEGPDVRIIPWKAIIILIVLAAIFWALYVRWRRFRQNRIDPVIDEIADGIDDAGHSLAEKRRSLKDWFGGSK